MVFGYVEIVIELDANYRWLYMTQWETGGNILTGLYNAASPYTFYREKTVGNPDIHWEVVRKFNFGIDYSFFGGLLAGHVELFRAPTSCSRVPTVPLRRSSAASRRLRGRTWEPSTTRVTNWSCASTRPCATDSTSGVTST